MDTAGWATISSNAAVSDALFNATRRESITDIGDEILANSLSSTDDSSEKTTIKDNFSASIVDKEEALSISNFASGLSAMDIKLKSAGNTSGVEGLRQVAMHFAKDTDGFSDFMNSVDKMDDSTFQKFFSTVDKATEKGLNVGNLVDNVTSASNKTQEKNIVDSTNKILSDTKATTSDMKSAYDKLMASLKTIESSNTSQTDKDSKLTNFFTAITKSSGVTEIGAAIDKFNKV